MLIYQNKNLFKLNNLQKIINAVIHDLRQQHSSVEVIHVVIFCYVQQIELNFRLQRVDQSPGLWSHSCQSCLSFFYTHHILIPMVSHSTAYNTKKTSLTTSFTSFMTPFHVNLSITLFQVFFNQDLPILGQHGNNTQFVIFLS